MRLLGYRKVISYRPTFSVNSGSLQLVGHNHPGVWRSIECFCLDQSVSYAVDKQTDRQTESAERPVHVDRLI